MFLQRALFSDKFKNIKRENDEVSINTANSFSLFCQVPEVYDIGK